MNLHDLTISQAHELLVRREVSSVDLTKALLERIAALDDKVKAYITVTPELALRQAREADARLAAAGQRVTPLTGVPVALKDVLATAGVRTTCGSKILHNFVPPYSATVVEKLYAAGAVVLGKVNMDEFAMGSSTENSAFFPTRNPWDLERVPGGSSGGSAAAVAAGEAVYSLGSDTGGSVRLPASFCGLVGLKPTYGRISRFGLVAYASSLDQIGPITRDVTDCAIVMNCIAGYDPRDSTSVVLPVPPPKAEVPDYTVSLIPDLKGLKIGVPAEYFGQGMDPGVESAIREAIAVMEGLGAQVGQVSLPHTKYAIAAYYIIAPAEASANLARYDGIKYGFSVEGDMDMWEAYSQTRQFGFGAEVKRRIMLGTYALSAGYYDAYYLRAQKARTLIKGDFDSAFQEYDALVTPTCPTAAFKLGEKMADPLSMYLSDVCTVPINIAGLPAMSVPCGFVDGLPVGLQIIGRTFDEETILRVAYAYEQSTSWHKARPKL